MSPPTVAGRRLACRALAGTAVAAGVQACSSGRTIPALPTLTASRLRTVWSIGLGEGAVGFWPAYADGSIWAADTSGQVLRVDARTGALAWSRRVDRRLVAGVGTDGSIVAVAGRDGSLIALDASGKTMWTTPLGADVVSVPAVGEQVIVVRTSDNRVQAFDPATGRRRWVYARQNPTLVLRQTAALLMSPAMVVAGMPGGRLVALSTTTGAVRWEASVSLPRGSNEIERIADVVGAPLAVGADVCGASYQGKVACFESASGRARWGTDFRAVAGVADDGERVYGCDDNGDVAAFDRAGALAWRQRALAGRRLAGPGLVGPLVAVGDEQGHVHALSRDDGRLVGRVASDGTPVVAPMRGAGDFAVAQTLGGRLFAVAAG